MSGTVGMLATTRVRLWDRYGQKMSDAKVAVWFVDALDARASPRDFCDMGSFKIECGIVGIGVMRHTRI